VLRVAGLIRRTFYGWWIVGGSFLILFITVGIGLYVPPVFLVPLQDHFGWSRAAIAGGGALAAVAIGILSPLVGVWIDRYGARRVMTAGALLMGSAFAALSLIQSLWHLYVVNLLAAVGTACVAWIPNQALVSSWFSRRRGLAMGIALAGIGFGGMAMAPLAGLLIARLGWRLAYATLSALLLLVVVTIIRAVVRSRPADLGLRPDGEPPEAGTGEPSREGGAREGSEGPAPTFRDFARTRAFWILSIANLFSVFASLSIVAHLVAFLSDLGFRTQVAATALGLAIGASVAGRVLFGLLADRFAKRSVMCAALLLHGLSVLCLLFIRAPGALPTFVILFGMGLGGGAVLVPLLVGELFGLASFGRILGLVTVSATLGAAVGPVLTGRIYDVTGSYELAFVLHTVAFAVAAGAVLFLRRPAVVEVPPERALRGASSSSRA
jgi:MFS family permease